MNADIQTGNVFDTGRLAALKRQAKADDPAANKEVARQFESLFMQMVLKAMRDAVPREGLFDNQASRLYESLHDQQLGLSLGKGRGLGLADLIERQLNRREAVIENLGPMPLHPAREPIPLDPTRIAPPRDARAPASMPLPAAGKGKAAVSPAPTFPQGTADVSRRDFVDRLMPAALEAERETGIPAHFMVAQAALETGWGKAEPRCADGRASHNLFGIKAGRRWNGDTASATTTEVIAGLAQVRVERFRAYGSYEESFRDYARLLASNPRYSDLIGAREPQQFARGLQEAGYATDPAYADKLERIIGADVLTRRTAA